MSAMRPTPSQRARIHSNHRRSLWAMVVFMCLYLISGMLGDLLWQHQPQHSLMQSIRTYWTFTEPPWITLLMLGAACVSVWATFYFHDRILLIGTRYRLIEPGQDRLREEEIRVLNIVEELRIGAGLRYTPEVYVLDTFNMNAFTTGFDQDSAAICVTAGLLRKLQRDELAAVMAHEMMHIKNNDIELMLVVSTLSNTLLILLNYLLGLSLLGGHAYKGFKLTAWKILLGWRLMLPFIMLALQAFLKHQRDHLADAGAAQLVSNPDALARALYEIHQDHRFWSLESDPSYALRVHAYFYNPHPHRILTFLNTHPSTEERLTALGSRLRAEKVAAAHSHKDDWYHQHLQPKKRRSQRPE